MNYGYENFIAPDDYDDFKKIAEENSKELTNSDGIFTIHLHDWHLFEPLMYTMRNMSHAIYRGVSSSNYDLTPSLFREPYRSVILREEGTRKEETIGRYFKHFRYAIRGRRGSNPQNLSTYEVWALGRHYGLLTPLLDWTYSPYVALFFAVEKKKESEPASRSVYCLKMNKIEEDGRYEQREEDITFLLSSDFNSLSFYSPLSDENPRMINQAGLFTVSRNEMSIEEWVRTHYKGKTSWNLMKININIDTRERFRILRKLNRMNINHATLFPDLEGAALYAKMQLSIKSY